MPCIAVNEIVLAAVGFIGDDNDIMALGKSGKDTSRLFWKELLNGSKDDAAWSDGEQFFQVLSAGSLYGGLP